MLRYILYLLTAITTYYLVMFIWGVSAGFSNYMPIIAVMGSIIMFVVAAPVLVINYRAGLILGLCCCLMMLPFNVIYFLSFFKENRSGYNLFSFLMLLPAIFNLLAIYTSVVTFSKKTTIAFSKSVRLALIIVPILLFIIYLVSVWKYHPWQWFTISKNL
jgi:hypothetical protein